LKNDQGKMDAFFDANLAAARGKKPAFSLDKAIDNIVGTFCDSIIVHRCAWGTADMIPEWLRQRITLDRLIEQMVANKEGRDVMGTDSEALAYLIPASLEAPMGHDWSQIYLYLATHVIDGENDKVVPDDIRVDQLDRNQMDDLTRLKIWIQRTKVGHRKEKTRDIRKAAEAEKKEERASLQTAMFDF
jgi:hypothetical protein